MVQKRGKTHACPLLLATLPRPTRNAALPTPTCSLILCETPLELNCLQLLITPGNAQRKETTTGLVKRFATPCIKQRIPRAKTFSIGPALLLLLALLEITILTKGRCCSTPTNASERVARWICVSRALHYVFPRSIFEDAFQGLPRTHFPAKLWGYTGLSCSQAKLGAKASQFLPYGGCAKLRCLDSL